MGKDASTARRRGPVGREPGAGLGSFIVDRRGTILGLDHGAEELTGWPAVEIVGRNKELSRALSPDEHGALRITTVPFYEGSVPVPARSVRLELRLRCRDGRILDVEAVANRLPGTGDRVSVTLLRVLAETNGEPALEGRDRRDPLTGLADGDAFSARLSAEIRAARISGKPVALVLADVDHLRRVNDRMGRPVGDDVLRKLAGVLRAAVGDDDIVARVGEDDFAVLLAGSGRGEGRQVAARIRTAVDRYEFFRRGEDAPGPVTLSLGAASFPADADDESELLQRAREALDEARVMGRNRVWCYTRRPRVPLRVPVYFDGVDPLIVGYTQDLSPSGVFISTPAPMDIGMRCALAFPLPGRNGKVHVIGRVVRAVPDVGEAGRTGGMGVEFERFGPEDRRAIERFLHANEGSSARPEGVLQSV